MRIEVSDVNIADILEPIETTMTPTDLDLIEAEFRACRKPLASERWAMSHGQRLIDELRGALRDREAMDTLREGVANIVHRHHGLETWSAGKEVFGVSGYDDPTDALLAWRDQQAAKDGADHAAKKPIP